MLKIHEPQGIPPQTAVVAKAAFPKGSLVMALRDELGTVYTDEQFHDLFAERGQPAESPARLALVIVLQFAEGLTDRQAADAVRGRIDWKYALGLELTDPGFDYSVLSEFRTRLVIYRPSHWPRLSTYLGFGTIYPAQVSVRQGSHLLPPWQVKHFANRILLLTRSARIPAMNLSLPSA
jgi:hypothetical protein